jgi:predicted RecB family nuclease
MKLVKLEDFAVVFDDELLLLKPFRQLYDKDTTESKGKFMDFLTLVYFVYDPRSDYSYIVDEDSRIDEVCRSNDMRRKVFTKLELKCIELYKQLTQSASSKLLEDTCFVIDSMRTTLRSIKFEEIGNESDKVKALNTAATVVEKIPKIIKSLSEAERAVTRETDNLGKARGSQAKTLMDDGILI